MFERERVVPPPARLAFIEEPAQLVTVIIPYFVSEIRITVPDRSFADELVRRWNMCERHHA